MGCCAASGLSFSTSVCRGAARRWRPGGRRSPGGAWCSSPATSTSSSPPCSPPAPPRPTATRRRSTCCRSACSASRWRPRSSPSCRVCAARATSPELLRPRPAALRSMAFLNVPTVVGYLAFGLADRRRPLPRGATSARATTGWSTWCSPATRWASSPPPRRACSRTPSTPWATRKVPARIAIAPRDHLGRWSPCHSCSGSTATRSCPLIGAAGGAPLYLGAVGLALASGFGAWMELLLLRRAPPPAARVRAPLAGRCPRWRLLALAAALPAALRLVAPAPAAAYLHRASGAGDLRTDYLILAKLARIEEVESLLAGQAAAAARER